MWKYKNFVAFLANLLLVGEWWRLVMYAHSHWDLRWRVETISVASFVMYVGTRFVEAARIDSQSSPRQFLSQKLVINAATTSIAIAAIFEISLRALSYAGGTPVNLFLLLALFGAFMLRSLAGRRSRRNLFVMMSCSAIALAAAVVFYFGSIDIVPFGSWIGFGMFVVAALVFMFLTEWKAPSRIGTPLGP